MNHDTVRDRGAPIWPGWPPDFKSRHLCNLIKLSAIPTFFLFVLLSVEKSFFLKKTNIASMVFSVGFCALSNESKCVEEEELPNTL